MSKVKSNKASRIQNINQKELGGISPTTDNINEIILSEIDELSGNISDLMKKGQIGSIMEEICDHRRKSVPKSPVKSIPKPPIKIYHVAFSPLPRGAVCHQFIFPCQSHAVPRHILLTKPPNLPHK